MSIAGTIKALLAKTEPILKANKIGDFNKPITRLVDMLDWGFCVPHQKWINGEEWIESAIVYKKDGSFQQTYGFRGYDLDNCDAETIAGVFNAMNNLMKAKGTGWTFTLEVQRKESSSYPYIHRDVLATLLIEKERREQFQTAGTHFLSSYYITFIYTPELEFKRKAMRFFYTRMEESGVEIEGVIQDFIKDVDDMTNDLSRNLIIRPLNRVETVQYLHSTISFENIDYVLEHYIFLDRILDDSKLRVGNPCILNNKYIPIIQVNDFPTQAYPAIFNELNKMPLEFRWVTRASMMDYDVALHELTKSQDRWAKRRKGGGQILKEVAFKTEIDRVNRGSMVLEDDSAEAHSEVTQKLVGLCHYNSCVMVWDSSYQKARIKVEKVKAVIKDCGFSSKEETLNSLEAFLSMTAGNIYSNIRRDLVTTGNVAYMLPLNAVWNGVRYNEFIKELCGIDVPLLTCHTAGGDLFFLQLAVKDVMHFVLFGPTGTGKSVLLTTIEFAFTKYPDYQVIIFDKGASAITATLAMGGEYFEPGNKDVPGFQPLARIDDPMELAWAVEFIELIFELSGITLSPSQLRSVESALRMTSVSPKEMRTMTTFALNCQILDDNGREISRDVLAPYITGGLYGYIFDGTTESISTSRFLLIEMEEIMRKGAKVLDPTLSYLFHILEQRFDGRPTLLVLDEVWQFLANEKFAKKIEEWLKVLRKKHVAVGFATQSISDASKSILCDTIIENCPTKFYLPNPQAMNSLELYNRFGLSASDVTIVKKAQPQKEYYYTSPLGNRLFELNLGVLQLALTIKLPTEISNRFLRLKKKYNITQGFAEQILKIRKIPYEQYLQDETYESLVIEDEAWESVKE